MKKVLSMLLVLATTLAMTTPISANLTSERADSDCIEDEVAFAVFFSEQEGVDIAVKRESEFTVHEIIFPTVSQLVDTMSDEKNVEDVDKIVAEQGLKNVQIIKDYISGTNLTEEEKTIRFREIDAAITDGYVDGYTLYTGANRTGYTTYGIYSGMQFYQRPSSEISLNYKKETERNLSVLNNWLSSAVDIVLTIEELSPISMAVTVLDIGQRMFEDNYTAKSGDYTEYYVRTVRRNREIGIIDVSGSFRTVLVDNKVDMYPYSIYHFADPSIYNRSAAVTEYMNEWRTIYSQYYNNKGYNLQAAYEQYTERPDVILYMQGAVVNSSMFIWEFK